MYTVIEFGTRDIRDLANGPLPATPCRDGLRRFYEGACVAIHLCDPTDQALILSLDTFEAELPDAHKPSVLDSERNINDEAEAFAAVILLGKHLPKGEKRNDALRTLAGLLLRDKTEVEDVEHWVRSVAEAANDELWKQYVPLVRATANRLRTDKPVFGIPKLRELVGAQVADTFLRWAGVEKKASGAPASDLDTRLSSKLQNDIGNAERFVARYGDRARYCHSWECWLVWTGEVWARDEDGQIMRWGRETAIAIYREAASIPIKLDAQGKDTNQVLRECLASHAKATGNHARLVAMTTQAETFQDVAILASGLDRSPWLLNVVNGTVDLRTGEMTAHRKEDLITKQAPVVFDPTARCPTWDSFVAHVLPDVDLCDYVQRIAGYTLSADTREQCLFFLFGGGRNGKSTFMETIIGMIGPYSTKTRSETLMVKRGSGVPNDVAALCGARLVSVAEIGDGQRIDEALVKDLVGQDTMQARFLFKELFDFVPSHKLWLYGNHKPAIRGTDVGIWRRIKLIPFAVTIAEDEVDSQLPSKLRTELSGILNWALQGCQKWQADGLGEPKAVQEAVKEYRSEMDTISQFFHECCVTGPRHEVSRADLYAAYKGWCDESGEYQVTSTKFALRIKERGIDSREYGTYRWCGIGLLSSHTPTVTTEPWVDEEAEQEEPIPFELKPGW